MPGLRERPSFQWWGVGVASPPYPCPSDPCPDRPRPLAGCASSSWRGDVSESGASFPPTTANIQEAWASWGRLAVSLEGPGTPPPSRRLPCCLFFFREAVPLDTDLSIGSQLGKGNGSVLALGAHTLPWAGPYLVPLPHPTCFLVQGAADTRALHSTALTPDTCLSLALCFALLLCFIVRNEEWGAMYYHCSFKHISHTWRTLLYLDTYNFTSCYASISILRV